MVTLWRLLRNRIPYELWTILKSDNEEEIEEMFLLGVWVKSIHLIYVCFCPAPLFTRTFGQALTSTNFYFLIFFANESFFW